MTVRSLIDRHLADFSASDTRVARRILEKYPVSALGGIGDIALQSGVSAPTVTRFVKRLGFKRFADFQRAIRLEVQDSEASPLALFRKHQSQPAKRSDPDRLMVEQMTGSLRKLLETPTQRALDKAASILANARSRIYLLGGRWSSAAAQYAAFQLTSLRGEVHVLAPQASGLHEDRIADFTRRDVLLAYDFRRYQAETIAFCQTAKQRGVQLVLFTDLDLSPIADIADVVIPVTVETTSPLETLAVALAATDALLGRLVRKLGPQANRRMAMLETLRRDANTPKLL
ncbi:MurR/RpiR family transcriptional regulator [Aestuariivirga sp.]|uniref:MurR/RpiR family transcriptional regulator n=1 Tax=Aestuariivirga sp. TaxID=2650926 RepID=UPI0035942C37